MKTTTSKILLPFLLASYLCVAHYSAAQDLQFPIAHYPLETTEYYPDISYAKFTLVSAWDVSGNGKHGTVIDASPDPLSRPDAAFKPKAFVANGRTFLSRGDIRNVYIAIPEPFSEHSPDNGFSIAFWVYWDDADVSSNTKDVLLLTENFQVEKDGAALRLHYRRATNGVASADVYVTGNPGWYYCAITYDNSDGQIRMFKYRYTEPVEGSTLIPAGEHTTYTGTFHLLNGVHNYAQIASGEFTTGLCHVQFYGKTLSTTEMTQRMIDVLELERQEYTSRQYPLTGPHVFYPLNNNAQEVIRDRTGVFHGVIQSAASRFGEQGEAVNLSANSYVFLPSIFKSYDSRKGYTISFWMKPANNPSTPTDGITYPFEDTDPKYKIFYGNDASGNTRIGMQRIKDRLGQLRYTYDRLGNFHPFYLWWYDPASVRNVTEWVHVVLVQHENWQRVYVADRLQAINCNCSDTDMACLKQCLCYYTYQGTQDVSGVTEWGIGNPDGPAEGYMDDFRVYTYPMSAFEVSALHEVESNQDIAGEARAATEEIVQGRSATKEGQVFFEQEFSAYPNPTSGELMIRLPLSDEPVDIELTDLFGRIFIKRTEKPGTGATEIRIKNLYEYINASGLYILKVTTRTFTGKLKLVLN